MSDALYTTILYCEIAASNLFVLMTIFHFQKKRLSSFAGKRMVSCMLIISEIFLICDIIWAILDYCRGEGMNISGFIGLNYTVNTLYFITRSLIAFVWTLYTEQTLCGKLRDRLTFIAVLFIPACCDLVISMSSHVTGLYFSVDAATGIYSRGPIYSVHQIIFTFYIIYSAVRIFSRLVSPKYYSEHEKYTAMMWFCVPLVLAAIIQVLISLPVLGIGIAVSMLQMQLHSTNRLVTADELTSLNNRNQLLKFLDTKMASFAEDFNNSNSLFLFIIDVDDFKAINDNFGHVEGDEALKLVANSMKRICGKYNCFCARYGGDEFVMVGEFYDALSAEAVSNELNKLIGANSKGAGKEYKLCVSVGFAQYGDDTETIPEFIDKADKMLYEIKREKKLER